MAEASRNKLTLKRIIAAAKAADNQGLCVYCGAKRYNVEPDARGLKCRSCGCFGSVYGAEELLLIEFARQLAGESMDSLRRSVASPDCETPNAIRQDTIGKSRGEMIEEILVEKFVIEFPKEFEKEPER